MEYVLDENGNIKIGPKGNPLVKGSDGKEFEIDAIGAAGKITELNAENKKHRKKTQDAENQVETLTTTNADLQTTVDSIGEDNKLEMEKYKADTTAAWQTKVDGLKGIIKTQKDDIFENDVVSKIRNSDLIKTTVLPPAIFVNTFKDQFQDDKSAKGWDGNTILSKENPSINAGTKESLAVLLDTHPDRDKLLKGSGAHGGENHNDDGNQHKDLSSKDKIKVGIASRKK